MSKKKPCHECDDEDCGAAESATWLLVIVPLLWVAAAILWWAK